VTSYRRKEEEEEYNNDDDYDDEDCCVGGAHPFCGAFSRRGFHQLNLIYTSYNNGRMAGYVNTV